MHFDNDQTTETSQCPGLTQHFHENHGRGNNQNRIQVGKSALYQMPEGNPLTGNQSADD